MLYSRALGANCGHGYTYKYHPHYIRCDLPVSFFTSGCDKTSKGAKVINSRHRFNHTDPPPTRPLLGLAEKCSVGKTTEGGPYITKKNIFGGGGEQKGDIGREAVNGVGGVIEGEAVNEWR